ncbi:MAG: hypothetical protein WCP29_18175 [Acidobacteriota bacterium]
MELAPDFNEFFDSLIAHNVEVLIVGASALAFHGAPRFTGDIDVLTPPVVSPVHGKDRSHVSSQPVPRASSPRICGGLGGRATVLTAFTAGRIH